MMTLFLGDFVTAKLTITDAAAIEALKEGSRKEISLGYTCEVEESPGVHNGEHYRVLREIDVAGSASEKKSD